MALRNNRALDALCKMSKTNGNFPIFCFCLLSLSCLCLSLLANAATDAPPISPVVRKSIGGSSSSILYAAKELINNNSNSKAAVRRFLNERKDIQNDDEKKATIQMKPHNATAADVIFMREFVSRLLNVSNLVEDKDISLEDTPDMKNHGEPDAFRTFDGFGELMDFVGGNMFEQSSKVISPLSELYKNFLKYFGNASGMRNAKNDNSVLRMFDAFGINNSTSNLLFAPQLSINNMTSVLSTVATALIMQFASMSNKMSNAQKFFSGGGSATRSEVDMTGISNAISNPAFVQLVTRLISALSSALFSAAQELSTVTDATTFGNSVGSMVGSLMANVPAQIPTQNPAQFRSSETEDDNAPHKELLIDSAVYDPARAAGGEGEGEDPARDAPVAENVVEAFATHTNSTDKPKFLATQKHF